MSSAIYVLIVLVPLIFLLLLKLYCKLTVGKCRCQQDMTGKTVLITGASAGIGKATALELARRNARVLLACRNRRKAEMVKSDIITATGNMNLEVKHLDLDSFVSVRKCAEDVLKTEERLDVLINNAGIVTINRLEVTEDGCERNMQSNHLGHFLLTLLLLDLLKKSKPSRIINVCSIVYIFGVLNVDDMDGARHNFFLRQSGNYYFRSKLANLLFSTELAKRLSGTGVTVNAVHPGAVHTGILYQHQHPVLWFFRFCQMLFGRSPEEAAQTSLYLAVDPEIEEATGKLFYDCKEGIILGQGRNRRKAEIFFRISEGIVGETCPIQADI